MKGSKFPRNLFELFSKSLIVFICFVSSCPLAEYDKPIILTQHLLRQDLFLSYLVIRTQIKHNIPALSSRYKYLVCRNNDVSRISVTYSLITEFNLQHKIIQFYDANPVSI